MLWQRGHCVTVHPPVTHVHSEIVRSFFSIGIKFGYEGFLCLILHEGYSLHSCTRLCLMQEMTCLTRARFDRESPRNQTWIFFSNSKSTCKTCENGINFFLKSSVKLCIFNSPVSIVKCLEPLGETRCVQHDADVALRLYSTLSVLNF